MTDGMLGRILVPLDGSPAAEEILCQLRRILPRHDCQLVLLHAIPFAPLSTKEESEKYLRRISFQLTNDGYPATHLVRLGTAAETILDVAAEVRASLIAMTSHGRSGAARWVLGSVAERILQVSEVPVLVDHLVRSTLSSGKRASLPIRKILAPLDGSRLSLGALEPVLSLARPVDAQVTLLHVSERTPFDGRWDAPDETLKEAEKRLRDACIPARLEQRKGDPGEEILKASEEDDVDLIAMTTHGRSGPSRWVYGSVAAKVLRSARVPMLVVRRSARVSGEIRPSRGEFLGSSPLPL